MTLILFAVAVLSAAPARARTTLTPGGTVLVLRAGAKAWTAAKGPVTLGDGDAVRVDAGSAALAFSGGGRADLSSGARASVSGGTLRLESGRLDSSGARLTVRTPAATAAASGASLSLEVTRDRTTRVVVQDGVAAVTDAAGETARLGSGQDFRSLMVIPGWPMKMLPHPDEKARPAPVASAPAAEDAAVSDAAAGAEAAAAASGENPLDDATRTGQLIHVSDQDLQALDPGSRRAVQQLRDQLDPGSASGPMGLTPERMAMLKTALGKSAQGRSPEVQAALEEAEKGGRLTPQSLQVLFKAGLKPQDLSLDPSQAPAAPDEP
jgi:hypothetical protein